MFCQYPENKEQAVPTVRDDGIRQNGMGGSGAALIASQTADAQTELHWMPINKLNQGSVIVSMDMHLTPANAIRTSLSRCLQILHIVVKNRFTGSFFSDKLAINRVFSYHNNAIEAMLSHEIRALTLCEAW